MGGQDQRVSAIARVVGGLADVGQVREILLDRAADRQRPSVGLVRLHRTLRLREGQYGGPISLGVVVGDDPLERRDGVVLATDVTAHRPRARASRR